MLAFYRAILAWRRTHPVLSHGDIDFLKTAEPILAFRRFDRDANLLCVFNLSAERHQLKLTAQGATLEPVSRNADLGDGKLALDTNGYAFIALADGKVKLG